MTVQYSHFVLTGGYGVFFRLLLKWRGGVMKLISFDLIVFAILYIAISFMYRYVFSESTQRGFERLILFTSKSQAMIPVAFILGFYVSLVFKRFWNYFTTIPWVVRFAVTLVTHLPGTTDRIRLIRRTCMRYVLATLIIACARLNVVIKKRFPTFDFFVVSGILTEEEVRIITSVQPAHVQPFVPIVWATSLMALAQKEGFFKNQHSHTLLINEMNTFRGSTLKMMLMDAICIPLVYTQVVTLAVYSYVIASLIGSQFIISSSPLAGMAKSKDLYFPLFTLLELIVYVGWLKVAETLVNPMGEDDEDIDMNEIVDFNWKIAWCIVDGMRTSAPAVVRDVHWSQSVVELPHTERSRRLTVGSMKGSTHDLSFPINPELRALLSAITAARHSQVGSTESCNASESEPPHSQESQDRRISHTFTSTTTNVVHEPIKEEDEECEEDLSSKEAKPNDVDNTDTNGDEQHEDGYTKL
uniref:Bestrophin homolog n=1 Tax=Trichobilharzia regenti TaxID=157069 RepID=A0AA85JLL8_TRIRE|nr:unnamed protein product [Trichobilharzia regenti]